MPGSTNGALLMLPEEDRMQLQDRTAEQVRDWITSKTLAVRRYLLNLQSAFNSTLPVNTLPNEVLVEILRLASASDDSGAWMTAATGVCQYWRDVTLNTPVLWTNIDLSASPRFITLCLDRSRGAGLSMHLPRPEPQLEYLERAKIDFSAITPLLDSHHSRITNIDLYIDIHHDSETSSLWQVLDGSIPALCSLDVEVAESPLPWTPGPLPYLRSLSLTRVTPDWTKLPLSQLTSLKLCLVELPEDGPFASLLNVLKACASLEAFNCDFAHEGLGRLDRRNQHEVDRIMSLPRMRHIQLSGNGRGIKNLLARISLPRCARASLQPSSSAYSDSPSEDRPVLKAFLPTD
ncbi:uncharacterized protein B0H18DRAFT_119822, partial [Fomitopsis serialis]|uniref:uncharacterized protein n=1 Tax=Fomitopsis serialis TaxID=139415 RepID=UPI002008590D